MKLIVKGCADCEPVVELSLQERFGNVVVRAKRTDQSIAWDLFEISAYGLRRCGSVSKDPGFTLTQDGTNRIAVVD